MEGIAVFFFLVFVFVVVLFVVVVCVVGVWLGVWVGWGVCGWWGGGSPFGRTSRLSFLKTYAFQPLLEGLPD